jgi:hypothetical protein
VKIYPNSKDDVKIGMKFEDVNKNLSNSKDEVKIGVKFEEDVGENLSKL